MATLASLVDRVRLELGDQGKSFVTQFMADGSTNRFDLRYSPIDADTLYVSKDGVDISSSASVEESTGVLVLDEVPEDGAQLLVSGTYYRYFTTPDYEYFSTAALRQHTHNKTDSIGRTFTVENLPTIEEYPVALYASTLALYTLATDAAFDINIFAPDGVTIPRSERYRQLMEMIDSRREQYRELCVQLGIGMYQIEVFTLRRISKMTNRYVPVYRPMEVDDKSFPMRVDLNAPTYGDKEEPWPTLAEDLTAFEGFEFTYTKTFTGDYTGKLFQARLLTQRGSTYKVREFDLVVANPSLVEIASVSRTAGETTVTIVTEEDHGLVAGQSIYLWDINEELSDTWEVATTPSTTSLTLTTTETTEIDLEETAGRLDPFGEATYTATFTLPAEQTRRLARRTWWSLSSRDPDVEDPVNEIYGGQFFTERASEAVL